MMMIFKRATFSISFLLFVLMLNQCIAFNPLANTKSMEQTTGATTTEDDRRAFLSKVVTASLMVGGNSLLNIQPAQASGGATAGGAYLLSAKQRYNERVTKGVTAFLALEASLKSGSVEESKAYFASEEVGTWGDISTAGYLLANAFRRNSTQSPDSLPSVKKWKAFVKELDAMQKKLKKKDAAGAMEVFGSASALLDEYLSLVELPSVAELK